MESSLAARVVDNPEEQRFEVLLGDEVAGFVQYRARPGLIALIHTEVDDRFEGQGLASKLIAFALDDARAGPGGAAVLPLRQRVHPAPPRVRGPRSRGAARGVRPVATSAQPRSRRFPQGDVENSGAAPTDW